jgi:hypothetical protein
MDDRNNDFNTLESQWLKTFGFPPPIRAEWFMRGNLLHHQRSKGGDGLSPPTLAKIKAIAAGKPNSDKPTIRAGTKFIRVWQGEPHEVTVGDGGAFSYRGQTFKSLSGVARHITGTGWSGNAFIGVNKVSKHAHQN